MLTLASTAIEPPPLAYVIPAIESSTKLEPIFVVSDNPNTTYTFTTESNRISTITSVVHLAFGLPEESTSENFLQGKKEAASVFHILHEITSNATNERFEDGMESIFSKALTSFVIKFNSLAITALIAVFENDLANPEVISEALRTVGRIQDSHTHQSRLWLLERALIHRFARIRDAAILGLSHMDNPDAIASIRNAIKNEKIVQIRYNMEQALEQLELTKAGSL